MRNYVQMWYQSWDVYTGGVLDHVLNHFEPDAESMAEFAATLPPPPDGFESQAPAVPIWVLLNKTQLINIFNQDNRIPNGATAEFSSPRNGVDGDVKSWPSNDGNPDGPTYNQHLGDEKRFQSKTGDFSGANGLIDWLNALALYAAQLRSAGRIRDAGIVQFAYDQVKKGLWSITEAAQYLHDNGLV